MMFGNIVMLNLFLAILLGNFDRARHFHMKKNVFELFKKHLHKKKTLLQAIDYILVEDLATYIKDRVLEPRTLMFL